MKISEIEIRNFKRFSDLRIESIPPSVKIVVVVGPNGSGKTSLFEAFLHWYRFKFENSWADTDYYRKMVAIPLRHDETVKIRFHDFQEGVREALKGKFYFRSAYRNDADFTVTRLDRQVDPTESIRIANFIQNDTVVHQNYQRLVSLTLKGVYDGANDSKMVSDLRNELIGKIRESLQNVFDDLTLSSIGDPLSNGSFYFEKGVSKDFHYRNLSGGEKSAFDLLLDIIVKSNYFPDAVMCIDEPETHMHTRLQSRLFDELYRIVPAECQLWINTHSLGMLNRAREIERDAPGTITFINFDGLDFDGPVVLRPGIVDRTIWERFIEVTLGDLSGLIAPRKVVFCEGSPLGRKYKDFDAQVFTRIFGNQFPDHAFVSIGSSSELENPSNVTVKVASEVLHGSEIIKLIDRDNRSPEEVAELQRVGIRVLGLRNLESYLLEDEILEKLCLSSGNPDKIADARQIKSSALVNSIQRGNPVDDLKSASGEIFNGLRTLLGLPACGNSKDAFLRDTLAPLITVETETYKRLKQEILD